MVYQIEGKLFGEVVSRHFSYDREYVDKIRELDSIRLLNGYILNLDVKAVDEEGEYLGTYVAWIKDCVMHNVCDCRDVPEFF